MSYVFFRRLLGVSLGSLLLFSNACSKKKGCSDSVADNYSEEVNEDDGSCTYNYYRLCRGWRLDKYEVNGADSTTSFLNQKPNFTFSLFRENTYKEVYSPFAGAQVLTNGIWEFDKNYSVLRLTSKPQNTIRELAIESSTDSSLSLIDSGIVSKLYYFKAK